MRLYLVRHAAVTVRPDVPAEQWHLSPEGRAGAIALADDPCWPNAALVYTSPEPKAVATAQRIAARHGLAIVIERDLREVDGRTWTPDDYREVVRRYLAGEAVDSWEARDGARERIRLCIERIAAQQAGSEIAIVSHGLVLTLYVSDLLGLDGAGAHDLWSGMRFPDVAVVDPRARQVERAFAS